jgi:hypothetical protein
MKTTRTALLFLRAMVAGSLFVGAAPSPAQVQMLYSTPTSPARDNYSGVIGCQLQAGSSNVVVSHLGYFSTNEVSGLAISHKVGLFTSSLASPTILGQGVVVPAGTSADLYTNGFYWMHLDPPLLLSSNTIYILGGLVQSGDGDIWQDSYTPTWNTYFVGTAGNRFSVYGPGGSSAFPPASFGHNVTNQTYGVASAGNIPVGQAYVGVQTTNVSISAGQTLTVLGFASGAPTITYQWYTNSINTPLANQTNAALVIANATAANSGTYFLTASNALGGEQSANVTVVVTAFPVGIAQQPTNLAVFQNYQASFFTTATGSPPISYFWSSNGIAVPGANSTNYSLTAALANNGDVYSCLVSNNISDTPYTVASSNATLTVIPNLALPQEFLHGANTNLGNNNFGGLVGGQFTVGNSSVTVTHLGYYAWPANITTSLTATNCSLTQNHHVGIFSANGSVLYGYVVVPAGVNPVVNGYMWAQLDPPLVLSNNTQYLLLAETFSGTDPWGDTYVLPDLNPYFASACDAVYWGAAWPNAGVAGQFGGQMYSAPNLAILALSTPSASVLPTNVTQYAGLNATLTAYVTGQAPLTLQWYTNGIPLTGQSNLTLTLNNLTLGDSGNYYVIATNTVTGASVQSSNATVTVLPDTGPSITQDIQSQDAFVYSTVQFVAAASGTPPLSYRWTFKSNTIAGATNSTLTVNDVSAASVGNYELFVTNNFGATNSSVASLAVEVPAWGSYPSAVLGTNLLLFYPLDDAGSGYAIATNWGSLGFADNGLYTNGFSSIAGPTNLNFDGFSNLAVSLDGLSGYVQVPPLANVVVSNITIAAWVNDTYPNAGSGNQADNAAIFFQRSTYVFGLSVNPDATTGADQLRYTWNGGFFDSDLDLPTNQWALTAMVISPTNATVYLRDGTGLQSTNFVRANPSATFDGNSEIGWDTAGGNGGRLWNGPIADVMVFDSALSPVAVNALYLGVPASATLTIAPSGANLVVTWPGGTLQEATQITGPWTPTIGATNGTYTFTPAAIKFYRVQLQ